MRLTRVYTDTALDPGATVRLTGGTAQHLRRVLRAGTGDPVVLFDGSGFDFAAEIQGFHDGAVVVRVERRQPAAGPESPLDVTLLQGVSRGERMDFVLQKATELGVTTIAPVITERSVVRLDEAQAARRVAHWRGIAVAACEQSGRATLPRLEPPVPLARRLTAGETGATRVMLARDGERSLADTVLGAHHIELLIGPEGGLSPQEREAARAAGFVGATLGPRVLRTETAALVALAIAQQVAGDLGRPIAND